MKSTSLTFFSSKPRFGRSCVHSGTKPIPCPAETRDTSEKVLDLAKHIISTKLGEFDPATFDDRYEQAVAELVKAKIEGKSLPKPKKVQVSKPNDLLAALRESAGLAAKSTGQPKRTAANANKGTQRQRAARGAAKTAAPAAPQRKAG